MKRRHKMRGKSRKGGKAPVMTTMTSPFGGRMKGRSKKSR